MHRLLVAAGLTLVFVLLSTTPAAAAAIVANGSFEGGFPASPDNDAWQSVGYREDIALVPGWTETADGVDWHRNVADPGAPAAQDGARSIDLVGAAGSGELQQVLPTTTGAHYTLSFHYAANPACVGAGSATARVTAGSATVEVQSTGSNSYRPATLGFTATGTATTISFRSLTGGALCSGGVTIDNVAASCTAPVPAGGTPCVTGTSAIRGTTGCAGTPFRVVVEGREIERVIFTLDGKSTGTLTRPNVGSLYVLPVNPRTLPLGVHRVLARVIYTRRSGTADKLQRVTFARCVRRATSPNFTDDSRQCSQARVDVVQLSNQVERAKGRRKKILTARLNKAKANAQRYCS